MPRRSADLQVVCLAAALGVLAQTAALPVAPRTALGAPLLLLWPGYALTAALFPRWTLGWIERVIFSLGLSLMSGIIGAVVLNFTAWGLTAPAWTVLGAGVTLAASLVAAWRRRQLSADKPVLPTIAGGHLALMAVAALMTVGAVGLSRAQLYRPDAQGYTMLWLVQDNESGPPQLRLGVRSAELTTQSYRLELTAGGVMVAEWPSFSVAPGQTWETTTLLAGLPEANKLLEARLYRNDEPGTLYRRVTWWGVQ
jgi:hypothetical protein